MKGTAVAFVSRMLLCAPRCWGSQSEPGDSGLQGLAAAPMASSAELDAQAVATTVHDGKIRAATHTQPQDA